MINIFLKMFLHVTAVCYLSVGGAFRTSKPGSPENSRTFI